jgi:hypothetical protein
MQIELRQGAKCQLMHRLPACRPQHTALDDLMLGLRNAKVVDCRQRVLQDANLQGHKHAQHAQLATATGKPNYSLHAYVTSKAGHEVLQHQTGISGPLRPASAYSAMTAATCRGSVNNI